MIKILLLLLSIIIVVIAINDASGNTNATIIINSNNNNSNTANTNSIISRFLNFFSSSSSSSSSSNTTASTSSLHTVDYHESRRLENTVSILSTWGVAIPSDGFDLRKDGMIIIDIIIMIILPSTARMSSFFQLLLLTFTSLSPLLPSLLLPLLLLFSEYCAKIASNGEIKMYQGQGFFIFLGSSFNINSGNGDNG